MHVRPYLGEALPNADELTGLVVLGGPTGAADDEMPAHLVCERRLLAQAVTLGLPVLGVCFGAQLLAVALGGSVTRSQTPEIGMDAVRLTAVGQTDPVLGHLDREFPALQWHHDTYVPPRDAVSLASSDACADQAFRYGDRAYGLQFHAEIDSELAAVIRPQLPGVLLGEAAVEQASRSGARLLDRFLALS